MRELIAEGIGAIAKLIGVLLYIGLIIVWCFYPEKFRIGNYFQWSEYASMGIGVDEITKDNHYNYPQLREPVELNIAWLIKLGFKYYKPLRHYKIDLYDGMLYVEVREENNKFYFTFTNLGMDETQSMPEKIVRYVHKLQNLFYELFSEELRAELA